MKATQSKHMLKSLFTVSTQKVLTSHPSPACVCVLYVYVMCLGLGPQLTIFTKSFQHRHCKTSP